MLIGNVPLRDLTAQDVRRTLSKLAQTRSTRTMASTHNVLVRAIRHAEPNDHVGRNALGYLQAWAGITRTGYYGTCIDGREPGRFEPAGLVVTYWLQGHQPGG